MKTFVAKTARLRWIAATLVGTTAIAVAASGQFSPRRLEACPTGSANEGHRTCDPVVVLTDVDQAMAASFDHPPPLPARVPAFNCTHFLPARTVPVSVVPDPVCVGPEEFEAHRVAGDPSLDPNQPRKASMTIPRRTVARGERLVCVDAAGVVTHVFRFTSNQAPWGHLVDLEARIRRWRFAPWRSTALQCRSAGSFRCSTESTADGRRLRDPHVSRRSRRSSAGPLDGRTRPS